MNKLILFLAIISTSASSFASIYECGSLKYRGHLQNGGSRYQIQKTQAQVILYTTAGTPNGKSKKTNMKLVHASPELQMFSAADLDATFIYNMKTHKSDVKLVRASNKDFSTSCEELLPKILPKQ